MPCDGRYVTEGQFRASHRKELPQPSPSDPRAAAHLPGAPRPTSYAPPPAQRIESADGTMGAGCSLSVLKEGSLAPKLFPWLGHENSRNTNPCAEQLLDPSAMSTMHSGSTNREAAPRSNNLAAKQLTTLLAFSLCHAAGSFRNSRLGVFRHHSIFSNSCLCMVVWQAHILRQTICPRVALPEAGCFEPQDSVQQELGLGFRVAKCIRIPGLSQPGFWYFRTFATR